MRKKTKEWLRVCLSSCKDGVSLLEKSNMLCGKGNNKGLKGNHLFLFTFRIFIIRVVLEEK